MVPTLKAKALEFGVDLFLRTMQVTTFSFSQRELTGVTVSMDLSYSFFISFSFGLKIDSRTHIG